VLDDSTSLKQLELAADGKPLNILCRCTSYAQVRAAVLSGQCAALVPNFVAKDLEKQECRMKPIPKITTGIVAEWNPAFRGFNPRSDETIEWAVEKWLSD
jgi:DNA-binding transcriptional LysR family regulator